MNAHSPIPDRDTLFANAVSDAVTKVHHGQRAWDAVTTISLAAHMVRTQAELLRFCRTGLESTETRRAELAAELRALADQVEAPGGKVTEARRRG